MKDLVRSVRSKRQFVSLSHRDKDTQTDKQTCRHADRQAGRQSTAIEQCQDDSVGLLSLSSRPLAPRTLSLPQVETVR